MLPRCATELGLKKLFVQNVPIFSLVHTSTYPAMNRKVCPGIKGLVGTGSSKSGGTAGSKGGGGSSAYPIINIKRAEYSGPVRFGFIPDEWFKFFYIKTGVTGPYIFGIVVLNYMLSKEIYVLEHEYYSGLSIALLVYLGTTRLGPAAGAALDRQVDAVVASWQKVRDDEIAHYDEQIKACKDAQWRADGQPLLMAAKKENIAMQYEAAYRERLMQVYLATKNRMDYQVKKNKAESKINQKWMIAWILQEVSRSITPEFQKSALQSAIQDLAAAK